MCEPVKLLADKMLVQLGSLGQAKVVSMSRAAAERHLEPADREPVKLDTRQALLRVYTPACCPSTCLYGFTCVLVPTTSCNAQHSMAQHEDR